MNGTTTRGTRQVQDTHRRCKAGMRHPQGAQGGYKTPIRAMRWVQDTYKGYKKDMRHLQVV